LITRDNILADLLEKILFNKKQLDILKNSIEHVSTGKFTPKQLRKQIIKFRVQIIDKLIEFFPFYHKQIFLEESLGSDNKPNPQIRENLKEKNQLLEEISLRINKIYSKLKEKPET